MTMQFLALSKHLISFMMQVTEYEYSFPVVRYNWYSDRMYFVPTCPVFAGPVTNESW